VRPVARGARVAVVTGAAGFLGSHLVDSLLAAGGHVIGLDNLVTGRSVNLAAARSHPGFRFRRIDLSRARSLPVGDRYFHLASPASPPAYLRDPVGTLRVNSEGTFRVLEAARRSDARVLIASTSEVYGDPEQHPQPEKYWGHVNPVGPRSCYDEGKRYAEALAVAFRRVYGLDVRIARIFNTYGPRMSPTDGRVISNFLVQGIRRRPFTMYGNGRQTRSFCYVDDLIGGLRELMDAPRGVPSPMNLGNPREISIRRTAELVARTLGVPLRVRWRPMREDDPVQRCPDIRLAKKHLGWAPRVSLEAGLALTAGYFRTLLRA
jgi:UDP-glucuronate decarboxylase